MSDITAPAEPAPATPATAAAEPATAEENGEKAMIEFLKLLGAGRSGNGGGCGNPHCINCGTGRREELTQREGCEFIGKCQAFLLKCDRCNGKVTPNICSAFCDVCRNPSLITFVCAKCDWDICGPCASRAADVAAGIPVAVAGGPPREAESHLRAIIAALEPTDPQSATSIKDMAKALGINLNPALSFGFSGGAVGVALSGLTLDSDSDSSSDDDEDAVAVTPL